MKGEPIFLQIEIGTTDLTVKKLFYIAVKEIITVNDHVAGKHRIYNRSRQPEKKILKCQIRHQVCFFFVSF